MPIRWQPLARRSGCSRTVVRRSPHSLDESRTQWLPRSRRSSAAAPCVAGSGRGLISGARFAYDSADSSRCSANCFCSTRSPESVPFRARSLEPDPEQAICTIGEGVAAAATTVEGRLPTCEAAAFRDWLRMMGFDGMAVTGGNASDTCGAVTRSAKPGAESD